MNQIRPPAGEAPVSSRDIPIEDLAVLARMVRVDPATGDLVLENGASRLVLKRDGTIRIQGRRVVGMADETIALHAAVIELN